MENPVTLRNAISGFNKVDVLAYIDSMNRRIEALKVISPKKIRK